MSLSPDLSIEWPVVEEPRFTGRTVIVTGAGAGIGQADAVLFAAHGAKVVVNDLGSSPGGGGHDRSPAEAVARFITDHGGEATAETSDVSSSAGADDLVRTAVDRYGDLDVLVNNAGVTRHRPIWELTDEDWDLVVDVNLKGTFYVSRAAVRHWRTTGRPAVIVNTTSDAGIFGLGGKVNYSAAKGGIHALTIGLARELAPLGIRVNEVAPVARTRLMHRAIEASAATATSTVISHHETDAFDLLAPEHVAAAVCWLASDECADITGQSVRVQGGIVELVQPARRGAQILSPEPWTLESITRQQHRLFDGPLAPEPNPLLPEELALVRKAAAESSPVT